MRFPERLDGQSVLDVGAWNGFFSFAAEERCAARVLATDSFCWSGEGWATKVGFDLAHEARDSKIESLDIDPLDLNPDAVGGTFDLVLFLGVLYHMRHPLLALEKVASVTRHHLILETHVDHVFTRTPVMAFYPGRELSNDSTNWFGPNVACVEAMLKLVGFRRIKRYSMAPWHLRLGRAVRSASRRGPTAFFTELRQCRMVFHAFK